MGSLPVMLVCETGPSMNSLLKNFSKEGFTRVRGKCKIQELNAMHRINIPLFCIHFIFIQINGTLFPYF